MKKIFEWFRKNLLITAGMIGAMGGIMTGLITTMGWATQQNWWYASRGYVVEYVSHNNNQQIQGMLDERVNGVESYLQSWTIEFINLNIRRDRLQNEIIELSDIIQKNINNGMGDTDEQQSLITIRDRMQRELYQLVRETGIAYAYAFSTDSETDDETD